MAQGYAEQGRVGIRASRKEAMDGLKDAQKSGLPEDDFKRGEKKFKKKKDGRISRENQPSPKCKGEGSSCSLAILPYRNFSSVKS